MGKFHTSEQLFAKENPHTVMKGQYEGNEIILSVVCLTVIRQINDQWLYPEIRQQLLTDLFH